MARLYSQAQGVDPGHGAATVKQVMFWVPESGGIGVGVSILSYAGDVHFGLTTPAKMCPDPEAVVERYAPEFEKLPWLVLMAR
jgi:diacylglycerol O-acyltransferase / wax synthase